MQLSSQFLCIGVLLHFRFVHISSFPHNAANDDMEIITVEEVIHSTDVIKNPLASLITQNNEDKSSSSTSSSKSSSEQNDTSNEPMIDIADDLIFLAERAQQNTEPQMQLQKQQHQLSQATQQSFSSVGTSQQIDLLTSADEDSLTSALGSSALFKSSEEQNVSKSTKDISGGGGGGGDVGGSYMTSTTTTTAVGDATGVDNGVVGLVSTPQIELRMRHVSVDSTGASDDDDNDDTDTGDDNDDDDDHDNDDDDDNDNTNDPDATDFEELNGPSVLKPVTPIDMSDFVALIPAAAVKSIAANYYRNDPEVQRAYAYLNSRDFMVLRQHIIELPEVKAFLRYLNNSGLDVVGFLNILTNITSKPDELMTEESMADIGSGSEAIIGNEIENGLKPTHFTTSSPMQEGITATTEEQLNGLHGLVDSILDILPQDQILTTFFDKLESNEQFSKLVNNIGKPAFAKILHNMQNSPHLRIVVFNLHNNGIYITKIVDSMKAYFFLGTF